MLPEVPGEDSGAAAGDTILQRVFPLPQPTPHPRHAACPFPLPSSPVSIPDHPPGLRSPGAAGPKQVPPATIPLLSQLDGHSQRPPFSAKAIPLGRGADCVSPSTAPPSKPTARFPMGRRDCHRCSAIGRHLPSLHPRLPSHHGTWGWGRLCDPLGPSKACLLTVGAQVVKPPWLGPVTGVQLVASQSGEKKGATQAATTVTPLPPLTFSLLVALEPKWVSGLGHVVGSCFWFSVFLIPSANLCLLVGEFNSFLLQQFLIRKEYISMLLFVFCMS